MEYNYEQQVTTFETTRREMLDLLTKIVPTPTDLHRRRWRLQQLENSIEDVKTTISACNAQLESERTILDELNGQTDNLKAQEQKLIEDVRLLEGVTGMHAVLPIDNDDPNRRQIKQYTAEFRKNFADFTFDLPPIHQKIEFDPVLEKNSMILVGTLKEYCELHFDSRQTTADLGYQRNEKATKVENLQKDVEETEARFERDREVQKLRINESTQRMKESILEQAKELQKQSAIIRAEYQKMREELVSNISDLESQQKGLTTRCRNLKAYNSSVRENMKRRILELEMELDRFEHRIKLIKRNPRVVDQRLLNMSLILTKKSNLIMTAVEQVRTEIDDFYLWLGGRRPKGIFTPTKKKRVLI